MISTARWTPQGTPLSAGIEGGPNEDCPEASNRPCTLSFWIVEIDPETMQITPEYDSNGGQLVVEGVTVALRVRDDLYLGSFSSDRLARIPVRTWQAITISLLPA